MTDKKITELNLKSATYYGAQLQMNHFTEELAELIQAAAEGDPQHIAEEIADVEVMVEQMEYLLSLDTIYIESWATHILLANDIESCIWHLAAPIKSINKLRRVNLATAAAGICQKTKFRSNGKPQTTTLKPTLESWFPI